MNPLLNDSLMSGHPLECSICLERMKEVSFLISYPDKQGLVCDHYFCSKCIEPLFENSKTRGKEINCPTCRRVVVSVNKSRAVNELLLEITKEREERRLVIIQKEELNKTYEKLLEEKSNLQEERENALKNLKIQTEEKESLLERYKTEIENIKNQQKEELRNIKIKEQQRLQELKEKHRLELNDIINKQEVESKKLNQKIIELNELSESLLQQFHKSKKIAEISKK